jgi:hypothetical protein
MSKIMWLLGILLVAAGVALGLKSIMSPGQMQIYGLTPETAAVLLVGGILSLGLGGVIDSLKRASGLVSEAPAIVESVIKTVGEDRIETPGETPMSIPGFGRKGLEGAGAAAAAIAVTAVAETRSAVSATAQTTTGSVADTIAALDQAKMDIKNALGGVESMTSPVEELHPVHAELASAAVDEPDTDEEASTDGELFVVEEKIIRGRPSRILSDDTVEAETDEGWMRFENLEHLNEYLDSLGEDQA